MPEKAKRRNLGGILLELGRIDVDQQRQALEHQREHGGFFGEALIALGFISPEELEFALASQFDLPYVFPDPGAISREVATLVSPEWALGHLALPISRSGDTLVVVVDSPLKDDLVAELEYRTGLEVELAIASPGRIRALIREIFDEEGGREDEGTRIVVSVEEFLDRAMTEGADRLGLSIRGRTAVGWWHADGPVRRIQLSGGWPRALGERLHPVGALLPSGPGSPEMEGSDELPTSLLWEGREVPVEVSVLGRGAHREVLVVFTDAPAAKAPALPTPPESVVREARLLHRAGSARFAVRLPSEALSAGFLARLPEQLLGSPIRSVHLTAPGQGESGPGSEDARRGGEEARLEISLPDLDDREAASTLLDQLSGYHFDAITLAEVDDLIGWVERLSPLAPALFVRLMSPGARDSLSDAGILWEIEVADDPDGGLSWRLFPLNISY